MKITIRQLPLFVVALLFVVTGCNTVSTQSNQYVGGPTFPPSDPAKIEILRTEPTKPHVRLGEVQAEPASDKVDVAKIEDSLRQAAAKMGADAVVVVADKTQVTGAYVTGPWWGRQLQETVGRVVVGVAIKYQ